jgi:hypothetical protein|tara:strand:+ start:675 stop:905 length:231 start_codon:yes stop_codon:yes gene_type:complete
MGVLHKMARFILDVANLDEEGVKKVLTNCADESLMGSMVTVTCIDKTNENQFYNDETQNFLSKNQVNTYNSRINNE